ncbi:MAG TPA: CBS domain-containing protein [Bacteroidia bacterium]|nr:CBS domain-containing protein [Bacteroidia bacterium]
MIARQLLSNRLFPLKVTDTCRKALELMNEFDVAFLPVVEGDKHRGYVAASDLLGAGAKVTVLKKTNNALVSRVYETQHLFEIITIFSEINSSVLSVVDADEKFIGIISARELVNNMASLNAFSQPGSIITIEVPPNSYSLSEISRIVEYNNVKILSLYVNNVPENTGLMHVNIKLNSTDIKAVIATFERYGYPIVASFFRDYEADDLKSRYDLLMKFLDI